MSIICHSASSVPSHKTQMTIVIVPRKPLSLGHMYTFQIKLLDYDKKAYISCIHRRCFPSDPVVIFPLFFFSFASRTDGTVIFFFSPRCPMYESASPLNTGVRVRGTKDCDPKVAKITSKLMHPLRS